MPRNIPQNLKPCSVVYKLFTCTFKVVTCDVKQNFKIVFHNENLQPFPDWALESGNVGNGPNTCFGEYGFKHRTQWVFLGSLSSGERTQWVPLGLLFVCQSELTEFFAELTEFAAELSEFSSPETVLSKQYSARFLKCSTNLPQGPSPSTG